MNTPHGNRQVVLRRRPEGEPRPSDFEVIETPRPRPGPGDLLCRTLYLSLDPYMRGRMLEGKSYTGTTNPGLGEVMIGGTVSEVVESHTPAFAPGDIVLGFNGWQAYAACRPGGLRKLDPAQAPITTALGVLGMPGMTAYVGLLDIGRPRPGETVVVSAAAGAVGSVVGQIARIKGCRAVGVAGSPAKCDHVVKDLGFDACVSYRAPDFPAALRAACPDGIDVYFENVGGPVLAAALSMINMNARIPLCGLISQYNAAGPVAGPDLRPVLTSRALIQGFIVSDHMGRLGDFLADASAWLGEGRLRYREDIVDGLERAPEAFLRLFRGDNVGKLLVRVAG